MVPMLLVLFVCGLSMVQVSCQAPVAPYITFKGQILPNNSYVELSEVGRTISDGVQCHTDLTTCCNASYGPYHGQWYSPYSSEDLALENGFGQGLVSLHNHTVLRFGMYRCEIDTSASIQNGESVSGPKETVYVGLYYKFRGQGSLTVRMRLSVHTTQPLQFTLTCSSAFGPATTVTWTRDSEEIEGGISVLGNPITPTYRHILHSTEEGVYICTVSNNLPSTASATINMIVPSPPSNLSVSQNGLTSVLVSWAPSHGADFYTIYYQRDGERKQSRTAQADDASITLSLIGGETYFISMIANTALSSTEAGPVNITIDSLEILVYRSAAGFDLYNGQVVKLTCNVTLQGTLTGTPTLSWQGPGLLPTPVVSFPSEHVVTSGLIFNSINSSHEGRYTCTAGLDNFPFTVEDYEDIHINTKLRLSLNLQIEVHNTQPLQFTLTCTSTGGPATYVSWMRGSEDIEGGMTILEDYRLYKHTLNGTEEGIYTCTVSNDTPDTATATINVTRPSPPSNLSVSQNGRHSVLVSWGPSHGAEFYTIYYQQEGRPQKSIQAGANDTSISITLFSHVLGRPFSYSIFAYTALRSTEVGPVNLTLDALIVQVDPFGFGFGTVGEEYKLFCDFGLYGSLNGTPAFEWQGPGVLPTPTTITGARTRSVLTFNPLRLSHRGRYTCSVRLEGFPYPAQHSYYVSPQYLNPRPMISVVASRTPPFYAGTALNLTCNIPLNAAVDLPVVRRIRWIINDVPLDTPVSSDRVVFSERNIVFNPLNFSDVATYKCDVEFINRFFDNSDNQELDLNIEALPQPEVEIMAPSTVIAGSKLTLECSVTVVPHLTSTPRVELSGPEDVVLATGTNLTLTHTLDPVLVSSAGQQYVCKTELEIESLGVLQSSQSTYTITVQIPRPTVTTAVDPPDVLVIRSSVVLTCMAILDPHVDSLASVTIVWVGPTPFSGGRYSVNESGFGLNYNSSLTISDVAKEDEGEYACIVRVFGGRNVLGTVVTESTSIDNVLVPRPTVTLSANPPGTLNLSSSVTLTCEATLDSQVEEIEELEISLTWGGPRVISDDDDSKFSIIESAHTSNLTILSVDNGDEGEYMCTVVVSRGGNVLSAPVTEHIYISVLAPLPPEVKITAPLIVMDGSAVTLECSMTGVPHDHITTTSFLGLFGPKEVVLANSTNFTFTHTLDPVLAVDAGLYFCKAVLEIEGLDMPLESRSHIHPLTVQVPSPTLTVTASPSDTVNVGSSVILKCECIWNAGIAVSFSWDTPIESPSSYADMAQSGNRLTLVANTTLSHVEKTDEGKYLCTVGLDNNLMPYVLGPTVNTSVFLRVLDYPTSVPIPTLALSARPTGILNTSSSVTLTCEAMLVSDVNVDSLQITWEGPRMVNTDIDYNITESHSGLRYSSRLHIWNLEKEDDEGEYTCILSDSDVGTLVTDTIFIDVQGESEKDSSAVMQMRFLSVMMMITGVLTSSFLL